MTLELVATWDDADALLEQVEREIAREELDLLFDLAEKYRYRLVYEPRE